MEMSPRAALTTLLAPDNSALLLIDHQPLQFANLHGQEPAIINNVTGLAKCGRLFGVPTILTTVREQTGGLLIEELQNVFPDQKPIDRPWMNAWEDSRVVDAVKKTGRKKIVMAALWTLAMPAIQARSDGYEVYAVTDASGGVSPKAHEMAVGRMTQAGVTPITWLAVVREWQRDRACEAKVGPFAEVLRRHSGAAPAASDREPALSPAPRQIAQRAAILKPTYV